MQHSNIQAIFDCVSMLRVVAKARIWSSILLSSELLCVCMMTEEYINISKAFGSSLVEKAGASTAFNSFVPINKIAEIKGLTSNRSLRLAIQKGKYIAREVKVFGGTSYEILYSSLEPEVQEKLQDEGCFSP